MTESQTDKLERLDEWMQRFKDEHPGLVPDPVEVRLLDPPGGSRTLWTDPAGHGWEIDVTWALVGGSAVPVGLSVRAYFEGEGGVAYMPQPTARIDAATWRALPIAHVLEETRRHVARAPMLRRLLGAELGGNDDHVQPIADGPHPNRRGRPRDRPPEFYHRVAALYAEAVALGGADARRPAQYVRDRLIDQGLLAAPGEHPRAQQAQDVQVRKFIQQARRDGLIPSATKENRP